MFYEKFWPSVFEKPFRKNRLVSLVCIFVLSFSAVALAGGGGGDAHQTKFKSPRKQLKQARKLIRKGELAEAENMLRRLIQRKPQMAEAKLNLARIFLKQNKLGEAYDISFDVAKKNPNNSDYR